MSDGYDDCSKPNKSGKTNNVLPIWGNEQTMNLNPLILANIQGSSYFKVHLFKLKTYHEVVDEIYYQVRHLEPWERGSRKTAGQTGMCGGVRGVGAGGIVSTAYCLLYKLYTLRLTRKQLNGLLAHPDSPFIRALGFMYIRYTQPPADLMEWLEPYLEDEEAVECGGSASSGSPNTIGQLARHLLTKLDWFTTLFPRIPVPIQKSIQQRLEEYDRQQAKNKPQAVVQNRNVRENNPTRDREKERDVERDRDRDRDRDIDRDRDRGAHRSDRDRDNRRERSDRSEKDSRDKYYDRDVRDRDRTDTRDRDRDRHYDRGDRDRDSNRYYDRSEKDRGRSDRERYRDRSPASSHRRHR